MVIRRTTDTRLGLLEEHCENHTAKRLTGKLSGFMDNLNLTNITVFLVGFETEARLGDHGGSKERREYEGGKHRSDLIFGWDIVPQKIVPTNL